MNRDKVAEVEKSFTLIFLHRTRSLTFKTILCGEPVAKYCKTIYGNVCFPDSAALSNHLPTTLKWSHNTLECLPKVST